MRSSSSQSLSSLSGSRALRYPRSTSLRSRATFNCVVIYSEQSELCRKLGFGSFHVLWQTVSSASFVPLCPILSSLISLSLVLSRIMSPCMGIGVWIGNQGLAFYIQPCCFSSDLWRLSLCHRVHGFTIVLCIAYCFICYSSVLCCPTLRYLSSSLSLFPLCSHAWVN